MPKSIGEAVKVISVTLTERQIEALRLICEQENINRSEWVRARINERMAATHDYSKHNHLPITPRSDGGIYQKLGKTNPFNTNVPLCAVCWPTGAPKRTKRYGKTVLTFDDGSEVVY